MSGGILGVPGDGVGRMDVIAHDDRYELLVDVPGVARDDLDVTVHGGEVAICGRRRRFAPDGGTAVRRFERRLVLGDDIPADDVAAHLANGVLRITLPRATRARRIAVGAPVRRRVHVGDGLRRLWQRVGVRRGPELPHSLRRLVSRRIRARS